MRAARSADEMVPVSDFNARASDWLKRLADTGQPLMITQDGETAAILLSPAAYDRLSEQAHFISAVGEGLSDAEEGRLSDHADVVAMMNAQFGNSED